MKERLFGPLTIDLNHVLLRRCDIVLLAPKIDNVYA